MVTCSFGILDETGTQDRADKLQQGEKKISCSGNKFHNLEANEYSLQSSSSNNDNKVWKVTGDSGAHLNNERTGYTDRHQIA